MELSPSWEANSCSTIQEVCQYFVQSKGSLPCSLPWARWIQCTGHSVSVWISLILSSSRGLGHPSGLFPSVFLKNSVCILLLCCYTPCLSHSPSLDASDYICWGVQFMKFLIIQFFQPLIILSLLGINIIFSTKFSNTVSLRSSLKARDKVFLLFLVGWGWVHLVLRPLLAYCTSPR
jgi:hypothetical protein